MISTETRTIVVRPLAEVFAFVADFDNLPSYDPYVTSVEKLTPGPVHMGSRWRHTRVQGRRTIEAPIELIDYEPEHTIAISSGSKGFDVRSRQTFIAVGDGATEIVEALEMRLSGIMRLFEPLIRLQVPKQLAEVHERLKDVLEQR